MTAIVEVMQTLERLNTELQDLLVRGLRVCGPEHLRPLRALHAELQRIGADYLTARLSSLMDAIEGDQRDAAAALLQTQAALRLFERILTLRAVEDQLHVSIAVLTDEIVSADEQEQDE